MSNFEFKVKVKSSQCFARIGELKTPHGVIETPVFMPVAKSLVKNQLLQRRRNLSLPSN